MYKHHAKKQNKKKCAKESCSNGSIKRSAETLFSTNYPILKARFLLKTFRYYTQKLYSMKKLLYVHFIGSRKRIFIQVFNTDLLTVDVHSYKSQNITTLN